MLWQRITFGALMIAAMVGLVWLDDRIAQRLADDWTPKLLINLGLYAHEGLLFTAFVAVVAIFAVREMGRLLTAAGYQPSTFGAALASVVLVFIPFQVRNGLTDSVSADPATEAVYTVNWLLLAIGATFLLVAARRRTTGAIGAAASTLFMILYIGLLAAFVVRLRMWSSAWLVAYYLLVVKICDIGAYFTGLAIGRHKLIEWLSPKKTWEGAIGGTIVTVATAWGVAWLVQQHGPPRIAPLFPQPRDAAWFGLAMAVVGQCGDLVESLLKRDARTKDSGAVVPAFGGILDIIDSPLLTAPVAYWMLIKS
jgi:phosphatidate cytidylyltransferase